MSNVIPLWGAYSVPDEIEPDHDERAFDNALVNLGNAVSTLRYYAHRDDWDRIKRDLPIIAESLLWLELIVSVARGEKRNGLT